MSELNVIQSSFFSVVGLPFREMDYLTVEERVKINKSHYENGNSAISTFKAS